MSSTVAQLAHYRKQKQSIERSLPKIISQQISLSDVIDEFSQRMANPAILTFYTALTLDPKSIIGRDVTQQYSEFVDADTAPKAGRWAQWFKDFAPSFIANGTRRECDLYTAMRTNTGKLIQFEFYGINDTETFNSHAINGIDTEMTGWGSVDDGLFSAVKIHSLRKFINTMQSRYACLAKTDSTQSEVLIRFTQYANTYVRLSVRQQPLHN